LQAGLLSENGHCFGAAIESGQNQKAAIPPIKG
jgi:hypothetical protein